MTPFVRLPKLRALALAGAALACSAFADPAAAAGPHRVSSADALPLHSRAAVIVDADSDLVVYGRRKDTVRPIASITKLMTALVVVEAGQPLDARITISQEDADGTARTASRLAIGTTLTRGQLLQLALMSSENRAAYALCRNFPGGYARCIAAMRRKAGELGMARTTFVEPTGLSSLNRSTPSDLVKLVQAAADVPLIQRYSTAPSAVVQVRGRPTEFRNTDRLIHDPAWDIVVQKTGYIAAAGRCLVLQAVVGGRNYAIVLLESQGRSARLADARRVRAWLERRYAAADAPRDGVRVAATEAGNAAAAGTRIAGAAAMPRDAGVLAGTP
jgi:D-alanyl-D-alanine endopeptidase (penicillin-binding protein 7)